MAEQHRPDRPGHVADAEGRERGDRPDDRVEGREEDLAEHQRGRGAVKRSFFFFSFSMCWAPTWTTRTAGSACPSWAECDIVVERGLAAGLPVACCTSVGGERRGMAISVAELKLRRTAGVPVAASATGRCGWGITTAASIISQPSMARRRSSAPLRCRVPGPARRPGPARLAAGAVMVRAGTDFSVAFADHQCRRRRNSRGAAGSGGCGWRATGRRSTGPAQHAKNRRL